jgi:hypothetical protein
MTAERDLADLRYARDFAMRHLGMHRTDLAACHWWEFGRKRQLRLIIDEVERKVFEIDLRIEALTKGEDLR